jgi:hypothetical protein
MAESNPQGADRSVSLPITGSGAQPYIQTYHMARTMKFFSVTESELESITSFNSLATFGFAAGSFVLALLMPDVLNVLVDYWLGKQVLAEIMAKFWVKTAVLGILALIFYGLGVWGIWKRRTRWKKVGSESFLPPQP